MNERREVKCPSGAILRIQIAPFKASKDLYQVLLRELKALKIDTNMEMASVYKELFCIGFSSPEIERALWECFKSCTYDNGHGEIKVTEMTFEPVEARDDFMSASIEVAKDNVAPFTKSLFAEFSRMSELVSSMTKGQGSK